MTKSKPARNLVRVVKATWNAKEQVYVFREHLVPEVKATKYQNKAK